MQAYQIGFRQDGITLILAAIRSAVAEEMLGRGDDVSVCQEVIRTKHALQAFNDAGRIGGDNLRILAEAFIGASPAAVARDSDCGGEGPVMACHAQFGRGDACDLSHEVRIAHGAEPDIVGKERAADNVVVAVDGIDAPDDGDGDFHPFRIDGCHIIGINCRDPFISGAVLLAIGTGIAAAQHGAEPVFLDLFRRDRSVVGLNDLADFLL